MKKYRYSTGMKAAAVLFEEVCCVLLVVCIILVSTLMGRNMLELGTRNETRYTESGYYEGLFFDALSEVFTYEEYKERFETDGVYDPEQPIDIVGYAGYTNQGDMGVLGGSGLPGANEDYTGTFYLLTDLESWSKGMSEVELLVESIVSLGEDGKLHQEQRVTCAGGESVSSDVTIERLSDLDSSLQQMVWDNVEAYYGVTYDGTDLRIYSETTDDADERNLRTYSGTADDGDESNPRTYSEATSDAPDTSEDLTDGDADGNAADQTYGTASVSEEEVENKVLNGKLYTLTEQELIVLFSNLSLTDFVHEERTGVVQELYANAYGMTIWEQFTGGMLTLTEMKNLYACLDTTLENIGIELTEYHKLVNRYQRGNTNLSYVIYKQNQEEPDSNMEESVAKDQLVSYGEELGSYFYYDKDEIVLKTNISGLEDRFYSSLEGKNNGQNTCIFVGVDTSFPKEDAFWAGKEEYEMLEPWGTAALVLCVLCVLGAFLGLAYLSMAAGRKEGEEGVSLTLLDRTRTEFALLCFVAVAVATVLVFHRMLDLFYGSNMIGMMIMGGGLTFTIVGLFLIFYLSFVRRIKAGTLWSGSLLYRIVCGIRKAVSGWKPSVRVMILFLGHVLLTLFIGGFAIRMVNYHLFICSLLLIAYLALCTAEAVLLYRDGLQRNILLESMKRISGGELSYKVDTEQLRGENRLLGEAINTIGEGLANSVDQSTRTERLKADLITNVSHDIKTPLTSIVNYVDLLKREEIEDEKIRGYIHVLDVKSQRLKQLTEDLLEASKISSGNIVLDMVPLNFVELVYQTSGEFTERFHDRGLTVISNLPGEPVMILADGRRIWRVIDNLYNNVAKYAMPDTRVYVDMETKAEQAVFSIKNISQQPLNIDADELTERFIRGDVSRNTEGSGLGLAIAQNLTTLMGGQFQIYLDGDLFKVTIFFPLVKDNPEEETETGEEAGEKPEEKSEEKSEKETVG